jgi:hypothetical protein
MEMRLDYHGLTGSRWRRSRRWRSARSVPRRRRRGRSPGPRRVLSGRRGRSRRAVLPRDGRARRRSPVLLPGRPPGTSVLSVPPASATSTTAGHVEVIFSPKNPNNALPFLKSSYFFFLFINRHFFVRLCCMYLIAGCVRD